MWIMRGMRTRRAMCKVIGWCDPFATHRRVLGSQVVEVTGPVSRWDETTNVIAKAMVP